MINNLEKKKRKLIKRKGSIRKRVVGTSECPRLTVRRSLRHIYAQVVNDSEGKTLAEASTLSKELSDGVKGLKKGQAAEKVGELLAERCLKKDIDKIVFDRNGLAFNGRVASLAEAARKKGLLF